MVTATARKPASRNWTAQQTARMYGCTPSTISRYRSAGIIRPAGGGRKPLRLSFTDVLTTGICQSLGRRGVGMGDMRRVGQFLAAIRPMELREEIMSGRKWLVMPLGDGSPVLAACRAELRPGMELQLLCAIDLEACVARVDATMRGD